VGGGSWQGREREQEQIQMQDPWVSNPAVLDKLPPNLRSLCMVVSSTGRSIFEEVEKEEYK